MSLGQMFETFRDRFASENDFFKFIETILQFFAWKFGKYTLVNLSSQFTEFCVFIVKSSVLLAKIGRVVPKT